jgi:hypothetical protein
MSDIVRSLPPEDDAPNKGGRSRQQRPELTKEYLVDALFKLNSWVLIGVIPIDIGQFMQRTLSKLLDVCVKSDRPSATLTNEMVQKLADNPDMLDQFAGWLSDDQVAWIRKHGRTGR